MTVRRNRRQAPLPAPGYMRPASLDAAGLVVTLFAEDGEIERSFDFSSLPGSTELHRAFAAAFDRRSGPGGVWRSAETCRNGYYAVRALLEHLSAQPDAPQAACEITPAAWASWRLSLPAGHTSRNRVAILRTLLPQVEGLPAETLRAVDRRIRQGPPTEEAAYSYEHFEEIRRKAATTFNGALARIRANREHLRRFYAGELAAGGTPWLLGEALDVLLRTGDVPRAGAHRDVPHRYARALGGRGAGKTWARLYLTCSEAFALAVLLVASESWNRSVLDRMRVPEHYPAAGDDGFDIHLVEVEKRRRPVRLRYTTNNLVDTGPGTPGRLMGRAVEATELARQTLALLGTPTDRLLVSRRACTPGGLFCSGVPRTGSRRWASEVKLATGDRMPEQVSLRRLRRTVQVLVRKEPAQNTQRTHDSVYLLPDPATRAEAQQTVVAGLNDALDHARSIVAMRMVLGDDADELVELSDHPELAAAIRAGQLDTATAACTDFFHSPFTAGPGQPCTVSFLWCLRCENAVATRRHLPRLVYLYRALDELRATLPERVWDQDWREHFLRLHHLLAEHTTPAEQEAAARLLTGTDRGLIDRLLRRGLEP